jgi:hypothetical protein
MLFTAPMNKNAYILSLSLLTVLLVISLFFIKKEPKKGAPELVKIALRDVGNNLLLAQEDSTSLILPIKEIAVNTFELSFNNVLEIHPNTIVETVDKSFKKAQLPENYRVEVNECESVEVAYSYMISPISNQTLVPCRGRVLPEKCYKIQVTFLNKLQLDYNKVVLFISILIAFLMLFLIFKWYTATKPKSELELTKIETNEFKQSIGHFYFYPKQHKLVKAANEINLSKKECEILSIFINRPNQIIKRDELTKAVWEDHGVFVGRSLDTYISKLRKKLRTDQTIKITNIHGVGYKLETEN